MPPGAGTDAHGDGRSIDRRDEREAEQRERGGRGDAPAPAGHLGERPDHEQRDADADRPGVDQHRHREQPLAAVEQVGHHLRHQDVEDHRADAADEAGGIGGDERVGEREAGAADRHQREADEHEPLVAEALAEQAAGQRERDAGQQVQPDQPAELRLVDAEPGASSGATAATAWNWKPIAARASVSATRHCQRGLMALLSRPADESATCEHPAMVSLPVFAMPRRSLLAAALALLFTSVFAASALAQELAAARQDDPADRAGAGRQRHRRHDRARARRGDADAPEDDHRRSTTRPAPTATSARARRRTTPGDGYHFLFSWAGTLAVNKALYKNLAFDAQKDFVPILLVADVPNILVVNNDIPAKDLADFEKYAKANPGKLNFGSTGIGSSMHLAGELFMRETGAQMVHVPYNAPGTATTNLIAGDIQLMFQLIPGIAGQIKSGKVRAIAVMAPQRSPALPDVPTTAELGQPKLLSSTWFALLAPKGTPPAVVARMNASPTR